MSLSPDQKLAAYFLGRRIAGQRRKQEQTWLLLYDGEVTTVYSENAGTPGDNLIDTPTATITSFADGSVWASGDTVRVTFDGVQNVHTVWSEGTLMPTVGNPYIVEDMSKTELDDGGDYACRRGLTNKKNIVINTRTAGTHNIKIERLVTQ